MMFEFKVNDNKGFRDGYKLLAIMNDPKFTKDADKSKVDEYRQRLKRELRRWAHRDTGVMDVGLGFMVRSRIVKDDGIDGFVALLELPKVLDTEEEAQEFFDEFIKIDYRPSMYDCTGQAFTGWYKLFRRNGRFYVYHSVGMDV